MEEDRKQNAIVTGKGEEVEGVIAQPTEAVAEKAVEEIFDVDKLKTEQIESMQEYIGEEITKLNEYANKQTEEGQFIGEAKTGATPEGGERANIGEYEEVKPLKTEQDAIQEQTTDEEILADNKKISEEIDTAIVEAQGRLGLPTAPTIQTSDDTEIS